MEELLKCGASISQVFRRLDMVVIWRCMLRWSLDIVVETCGSQSTRPPVRNSPTSAACCLIPRGADHPGAGTTVVDGAVDEDVS